MEKFLIVGLGDADGVRAGHQGGSGNTANRLGVEVGELETFRCHLINAGCLDFLRTEAAEIFVALDRR